MRDKHGCEHGAVVCKRAFGKSPQCFWYCLHNRPQQEELSKRPPERQHTLAVLIFPSLWKQPTTHPSRR